HYENVTPSAESALADPTEGMTPEQRLHWKIVHRKKDGVEADIDEIIFRQVDTYASTQVESDNASRLTDDVTRNPYPVSPASPHSIRSTQHAIAVHTLNNVLLPAMKEVGDKFGAGELILPFVLQSAEVMKKTVAHLENYLEKKEGVSKGKVVIATVYGDVHDIGKNLVKTILSNNGYDVIDLGKQVPAETIITKAVEADATAIGLSALLVSTSKQMPLIVNELHRRGHHIPVIIGGAAINRRFGRRILQTESGDFYDSGVFYCKDAFEGLETMDALIDGEKRSNLLAKARRESEIELGRAVAQSSITNHQLQRSSIQPSPIQHPKKWGVRVVKDMPLEMVFKHLSLNELYRLSWGAKNTHGAEWDKLKAEYDARLDRMKREAMRAGWLKPQAVYGYFPCQADGDDLIIYDPQLITNIVPVGDYQSPITRFTFPRQNFDDRLCLADYFAPVASGQMDVVALQVVTVGHAATELRHSTNTHTSAANSVSPRTRANATRGATPPSPNSKTIARYSNCCPSARNSAWT
ncbi:MAG: hypothetical protein B6D40_00475, partial [Anaerolineae bacterium UTCFX3]